MSVSFHHDLVALSSSAYVKKIQESKEASAVLDLNTIHQALISYYFRSDTYPSSLEQLLEQRDLLDLPLDPWGREYIYLPPVDWRSVLQLCQGARFAYRPMAVVVVVAAVVVAVAVACSRITSFNAPLC